MKKILLALSGGIDSATALALFLEKNVEKITTVFFQYQSKHNEFERSSALKVAYYYKLPPPLMIDLSGTMNHFKSSLLKCEEPIPEGNYGDPGLNTTNIPCRNMIFLSYLAGIADSNGLDTIVITPHKDDFVYPDTTPRFLKNIKEAIKNATEGRVSLISPFSQYSKARIVKTGIELKAPYFLTRSCYKEQEIACGKCASCLTRINAFRLNNCPDPITYA